MCQCGQVKDDPGLRRCLFPTPGFCNWRRRSQARPFQGGLNVRVQAAALNHGADRGGFVNLRLNADNEFTAVALVTKNFVFVGRVTTYQGYCVHCGKLVMSYLPQRRFPDARR
jgi:hypothetical protein